MSECDKKRNCTNGGGECNKSYNELGHNEALHMMSYISGGAMGEEGGVYLKKGVDIHESLIRERDEKVEYFKKMMDEFPDMSQDTFRKDTLDMMDDIFGFVDNLLGVSVDIDPEDMFNDFFHGVLYEKDENGDIIDSWKNRRIRLNRKSLSQKDMWKDIKSLSHMASSFGARCMEIPVDKKQDISKALGESLVYLIFVYLIFNKNM